MDTSFSSVCDYSLQGWQRVQDWWKTRGCIPGPIRHAALKIAAAHLEMQVPAEVASGPSWPVATGTTSPRSSLGRRHLSAKRQVAWDDLFAQSAALLWSILGRCAASLARYLFEGEE